MNLQLAINFHCLKSLQFVNINTTSIKRAEFTNLGVLTKSRQILCIPNSNAEPGFSIFVITFIPLKGHLEFYSKKFIGTI